RAVEIGLATVGNVNLDLMFALPASRVGGVAQTMAECEQDVREAIAFLTPHLSFYQLTLEPNTVFAKKPPALPDHDQAADMQERVEAMLQEAGYAHYETSAYAQPGRQCQHNLNYWGFGDYVAIGAGAHGKISTPGGHGANAAITRTERVKQPRDYMQKALSSDPASCVFERRTVKRDEVGFEFMLNALRLNDGFPVAWFAERTGYPISLVSRALDIAEQEKLLQRTHETIKPTALGQRFLNRMLESFLQ
ncbi:MAG TPA: oxygen-independent coproporphyrinogen III oxidase-like protein, partial [Casimicrobium sp.]|nr:oxygen-independent coproporphyrinogen III oxidase-like protein [Casimicrobium sp.]